MANTSADINHKLITKILNTYSMINDGDKLMLHDISYFKYQLLKKHDKHELIGMNDSEFKKEMMEIIGA